MFPHTGGNGFPSLALRVPPSGCPRVKLIPAFLKLHPFNPAWPQPGATLLPAGAAESPQTPAHQLQPCLCQGEQILGAREGAESSFPFVLGVFSISKEKLPGEHLHTYLSWGFAWERSTVLKGPRRPAQKLLCGGGSYCSSPDEVHKDFMPQTTPLVQD